MQIFEYILIVCGGLVVTEATMIIILNTKRGYWELTNKFHVISAVLYLIYLSTVIFSSMKSNSSDEECDLLWKICSTLYISVTMSVYSFYYIKSRLVNSVLWRGKKWFGRLVLIMIVMMGVFGLCLFWLPIKDVQYNGILIEGKCRLVHRRWIVISWVTGDSIVSVTLLILFIKPLKDLQRQLGGTARTFGRMERITERNRNLLLFTVTVTISCYTTIAVLGNLSMRTVIYMCAIDRLVTLKCITMTFAYDKREYYYCHAFFILFFEKQCSEIVEEEQLPPSEDSQPRNSISTSLIVISSTSNFPIGEEKSLNNSSINLFDCLELSH
jgi:hypothetical protein